MLRWAPLQQTKQLLPPGGHVQFLQFSDRSPFGLCKIRISAVASRPGRGRDRSALPIDHPRADGWILHLFRVAVPCRDPFFGCRIVSLINWRKFSRPTSDMGSAAWPCLGAGRSRFRLRAGDQVSRPRVSETVDP